MKLIKLNKGNILIKKYFYLAVLGGSFAVLVSPLISGAMAMQNHQNLIQDFPHPQQVVNIPQPVQVQVQPNFPLTQQVNIKNQNTHLGFSTVGALKNKKLPDQFYFYNSSKEYISDGSINLKSIIKTLQKNSKIPPTYGDLYREILKKLDKKGNQAKTTFLTEMAAALRHGLPITKKKYEPCIEVCFNHREEVYYYNKNMLDFSRLLFLTVQTFDPTVANTLSYQQTLAHIGHAQGHGVSCACNAQPTWASQDHLSYWKL